jgi:hypothetical protein
MQLRFRLAAIVSALALVAGLGFAFAEPALAADGINMCLYLPDVSPPEPGIMCAFTYPRNGEKIELNSMGDGGSPFDAPTSGKHQISLYDSGSDPGGPFCMKVDLDGYDIVVDKCQGLATEEWITTATTEKIGPKKVTVYIYQSDYNSHLCLNALKDGYLDAKSCNHSRYQLWYETVIN